MALRPGRGAAGLRRWTTRALLLIVLAWCAAGCTGRESSQPEHHETTPASHTTPAGHLTKSGRAPTPTKRADLSIVVPGYASPSQAPYWDAVIGAATAVSSVIVNPDSGPGDAARETYRRLIARLRAAGVRVLGYVPTGYGARDATAVDTDIVHWRQWYGIVDIFLDEAADAATGLPIYARYAETIHNYGGIVVLNPGVIPAQGYFAFADSVVTFEGPYGKYIRPMATPAWLADEPRAKIWNIVTGAPSARLTGVFKAAVDRHVGGIFVTDASVPNPYDKLPAYWSQEAAAVPG